MRLLFLTLALLSLASTTSFGQSVRRVEVECRALFPFDPLTGRYHPGSLSQVAEYVDQWRKIDSLDLRIKYKPLMGYQIYEFLVDSTISKRVLNYFPNHKFVDSLRSPVDFTQFPHSKNFSDLYFKDIQEIKRFFATPLCNIDDTLRIADSYYGPSKFSSLFHRFQLEISAADISLFAPPAQNGLITRDIYIEQLYSLFKFNNDLVVFEITGRALREYLEGVYSKRYYRLRDVNSDLLRIRTPYYLHLSAAGLSYRVNLTKMCIEDFSLNESTLYTVVANSFIAKEFAPKTNYGDYRLLLLNWLSEQNFKEIKIIENWSLSPERWVKTISERERSFFDKNQPLHTPL